MAEMIAWTVAGIGPGLFSRQLLGSDDNLGGEIRLAIVSLS